MGFFSALFGKRDKIAPSSYSIRGIDYYTPEYYRLLSSDPDISKIYGRDHIFPNYSDTYVTDENFKLRELLLLVWWGKPKNGRKSTVSIPKYFFSDYNLNAEKLTRIFKSKGLIADVGDKTLLTEKGQELYEKYKALWEIHSVKQYPTNLDIDFPNWNKEHFELELYRMELKYYKAHAKYCKKMIDFFNSFNAPASAQEIQNKINYYVNDRNSDLSKVNDYQEKIAIMEERINDNKDKLETLSVE